MHALVQLEVGVVECVDSAVSTHMSPLQFWVEASQVLH